MGSAAALGCALTSGDVATGGYPHGPPPSAAPLRRATSSTSLAWNVLQHNIVAATYAHVASVCRAGLRGNACPFCPVGYGTRLCGCRVVGYGSKRISFRGLGRFLCPGVPNSTFGTVGEGGAAKRLRLRACPEAKDVQLATAQTGGAPKQQMHRTFQFRYKHRAGLVCPPTACYHKPKARGEGDVA